MIRKYIILLFLSFVITHGLLAQDKNKKITLASISSIGLLNGSKGSSLGLQTILGGSYKKSFLGLGVGLDYYRYRSVPLFADLRHDFGTGERKMFFYGDIGYNYDWLVKEKADQVNIYRQENNYSGGLYYDAGVGYKIGFNKVDALLLSAGYTFKKIKSQVGSGECPVTGPCYNSIQTYRYYLSRIVIKAGWRF